jgi:hypothetical protein
MDHDNPLFAQWCRPYGYIPFVPTTAYQREKLARYWLAWLSGTPPDCKKAHRMVLLSGLLQ